MTSTQMVDRLYSLTELSSLGYGSKNSVRALIAVGTVPAVRVGNRLKVRETDLHYIAVPVDAAEEISA